ncbi:hypothetical protein Clacol_007916 [Clathrus columnatus]|uniref:Protein kinase domain-containing protein n=1 Tax=Clathrus columnatus TaxID=1419009 RepID=A0AAV5AP15_9AGAM|nr:hypothetical protein Clacol_007916 [Clathrus columnatus]
MSDFERRILACVGPLNTPTKEQVKALCHQVQTSPNALSTLQETLSTRLDRPRELNVSTLEIEHILVVIRQCCFIAPLPFVDFFKSRLYLIASFCNYEDQRNQSGAIKVQKAALTLCNLLKNDSKLNEERRKCSPSSRSPHSPTIWLPSPAAVSSLELSPRARETPLLSPTPRRSFLPTPDASPVQGTSRLMDEVVIGSRGHGPAAEAVPPYGAAAGKIEMTIRGLLKRPLREILDSQRSLKEIAQATTDNLLLEYIFSGQDDFIIKVLHIMEYCVKHGSPRFISMLQDHQQLLLQLSDKPYTSQINTLAKAVLESIEARSGQPPVAQSDQHHYSPDRRNSVLTFATDGSISNESLTSTLLLDRDIRDLTAFVTSTKADPLSRGGYAVVYVAELDMGNRPELRLVREINAWTGLKHPNVGRLYGITREKDDRIGLISPFYEKGDIIKHIRNTKDTLTNKGFLTLMKEITAGVVYLHEQGIIHGDIKGANIMVDDTNHPRLIDFGVSRIIGVQGLTTSGYGTSWAWAAPELIDEPKKTKQSDIYALSSTFVEMMTCRPPLITGRRHIVLAISEGETPSRPKPGSSPFYPGDKLWIYMMYCWEKAESRPRAADVGNFLDELNDITDDY